MRAATEMATTTIQQPVQPTATTVDYWHRSETWG